MIRFPRASVHALAFLMAGAALMAAAVPRPALAQPVAEVAQLGMTLAELQAAYPTLQRMARPLVAPHGLRGQWRLPRTLVAGLPFETTFFIKDQRVQRIEQLRSGNAPACAQQDEFSTVVSALGLQYGAGSSGLGPQGVDAFGTLRDSDVSAHLQASAVACAIRIVYKPTALRDASTL